MGNLNARQLGFLIAERKAGLCRKELMFGADVNSLFCQMPPTFGHDTTQHGKLDNMELSRLPWTGYRAELQNWSLHLPSSSY